MNKSLMDILLTYEYRLSTLQKTDLLNRYGALHNDDFVKIALVRELVIPNDLGFYTEMQLRKSLSKLADLVEGMTRYEWFSEVIDRYKATALNNTLIKYVFLDDKRLDIDSITLDGEDISIETTQEVGYGAFENSIPVNVFINGTRYNVLRFKIYSEVLFLWTC